MDPSDPDTLYAATNAAWSCEVTGAVYKTTDGGDSWTNISGSLIIPLGARISEMDANNSEIYVSVTDKAADDGATWDESEFLQPADTSVSRIYMNPDDPEEVWIGLFNIYNIGMEGLGLFVTYDGGTTWQPVHSFHPGGGVNLLTKSPSGALYANGYRTSDGGSTWENYCDLSESDAYGELGPLAFDPNDEDTLYMALTFGTGLIKTTDGGRTWYQINDGMLNTSISMVVAHPNEPGTLYSGSIHGQGVSKTTDGDQSSRCRHGLGGSRRRRRFRNHGRWAKLAYDHRHTGRGLSRRVSLRYGCGTVRCGRHICPQERLRHLQGRQSP